MYRPLLFHGSSSHRALQVFKRERSSLSLTDCIVSGLTAASDKRGGGTFPSKLNPDLSSYHQLASQTSAKHHSIQAVLLANFSVLICITRRHWSDSGGANTRGRSRLIIYHGSPRIVNPYPATWPPPRTSSFGGGIQPDISVGVSLHVTQFLSLPRITFLEPQTKIFM